MRRIVFVLAATAALLSCTRIPLIDTMPRWYSPGPRSHGGGYAARQDSSARNTPARKGVYIAALRFPEWASWRDGDFRGAEAVLFRDSVEIAHCPMGALPDPDRMRIIDGHLWTDIAGNGETSVYCDGHHRLTIPDEELLKGFLIKNDTILTLGQRPGGRGLCYRVNGQEVFSSGAGTVFGRFERDSSGTHFAYGITIRKGDAVTTEYHIMNGADEIATVTPNKGGAIYDIRVRDGTAYRSERRGGSPSSLCLVIGESYHSMDVGSAEEIHQCKLLDCEGEMMIKGYSIMGSLIRHWIRSRDGLRYQVISSMGVPDIYLDSGKLAHLITNRDGRVTKVVIGDETISAPEDSLYLRIRSSSCADFRGGTFAAALSDTSGRKHRLFLDGRLVPLEFNGYFTSIKIIQ